MAETKKAFKEEFSQFFEEPTRGKLMNLLKFETGEYNHLDFKEKWPEIKKLIRHILAFSNSKGGCIIVGVKEKDDDTYESIGLSNFEEKTNTERKIRKFTLNELDFQIHNFDYTGWESPKIKDKKFQAIIIEDKSKYIPFIPIKETEGIKLTDIFIRKNRSSVRANFDELQKVINRRIETGYSSRSENQLEEDLAHLKVLYNYIPKYYSSFSFVDPLAVFNKPNPKYPNEDFEDFIIKMISLKKKIIESIIRGAE